MTAKNLRQLNPFEIKTEIISLISEFKDIKNLEDYIDRINLLDFQEDKKTITKLLFKELYNLTDSDGNIICFLLERYAPKAELTKKLWELVKSNLVPNSVKIVAINFLRGLNSDWELDSGDEVLNEEILDAETKDLLDNALVNPEIQIDFMDFLTSLSTNDKITLINSLDENYEKDALANILIPVFLSQPQSEVGLEALKLLGETKSQLAFHAINSNLNKFNEKIMPLVKKSLSTLKIGGIRTDNSKDFYKEILSNSTPYKCCATYPDGLGNQALIFTRKSDNNVSFMAVVINDYDGIRDCFGFYSITRFECDQIIERFYKKEKKIYIKPTELKTLLENAEKISAQHPIISVPYEYICWKSILADIDSDTSIREVLKKNLTTKHITQKDLNKIFEEKFTDKWFFTKDYSDETEKFLTSSPIDFDKNIENNFDKIFCEEEKEIWDERILSCAYLELIQGNKKFAEVLYGLYFDENLKTEFYKQILRKSIYEYYLSMKFSTELNNGQFTIKELDDILKTIEDLWICTK